MLWRLILLALSVGGYTYLRAIAPLRWRVGAKLAAAAVLAVLALRLPLLVAGAAPALLSRGWGSIVYSWLYVALVIWFCGIFGACVGRDVARRVSAAWRQRSAEAQQRVFNRLHGFMLAVALALSAWGTWSGLQAPAVRELTLHCGLQQPLRLVLLADLHVSARRGPDVLRQIVARTNDLGADIVCITGDFVDGSVAECAGCVAALRELRAPLGVYGVPGNHDYYSGYEEWCEHLTGLGVHMLPNAHVLLPGGAVLAGVTEESAYRLPGMEPPSIRKALHGAPGGAPVILLSHRPDLAHEAADNGVAVQLSGHTHGGLVWGAGWVVAAMNGGFVKGLYRERGTQLYVSPGTCTSSRTPLRLGVPAEITLITLM